jgi:spore germination cell wall hydrolase CwlJ-like protein
MPNHWLVYELALLALVAWREARGEGEAGLIAVCWAIRNRVEHPKWWGDSYSTVIVKPWQFSSMTAPGDPMLLKWPVQPDEVFGQCLEIADGVIHGTIPNPIGEADSYYATTIKAPYWAKEEQFVVQIGRHKYFNTDGSHPENMAARDV